MCAADNVEGSSSDTQPIFAMSNDEGNSDDVKIPAVLLFSEQGRVLNNAMAAQEDASQRLTVRLAAKATGTAGMKSKKRLRKRSLCFHSRDLQPY